MPAIGLKAEVPAIVQCRQLIVVASRTMESVSAKLQCYERLDAGAPWRKAFAGVDATVGRNGMAWGIGLHGSFPAGGDIKREGDGRAPAGVFSLHSTFGYSSAQEAQIFNFPYLPITRTSVGIDDPTSIYYNRVVNSAGVSTIDWKSSEVMLLKDGRYRWGIIVEHNWKPFPGYGSCIFMHRWLGPGQGTSGCTGMEAEAIEKIVRWLDNSRNPLLVQLPAAEYERLKELWRLP
jgi:D-alanyl-D-alanine dipeptidase